MWVVPKIRHVFEFSIQTEINCGQKVIFIENPVEFTFSRKIHLETHVVPSTSHSLCICFFCFDFGFFSDRKTCQTKSPFENQKTRKEQRNKVEFLNENVIDFSIESKIIGFCITFTTLLFAHKIASITRSTCFAQRNKAKNVSFLMIFFVSLTQRFCKRIDYRRHLEWADEKGNEHRVKMMNCMSAYQITDTPNEVWKMRWKKKKWRIADWRSENRCKFHQINFKCQWR